MYIYIYIYINRSIIISFLPGWTEFTSHVNLPLCLITSLLDIVGDVWTSNLPFFSIYHIWIQLLNIINNKYIIILLL